MAEMSQFKPVLTCRGWQILLAAVDVLQTSCTRVDFWTWFRISLEPQSDKHTVKTSYIVAVFNNQLGLIVVMQEQKKKCCFKNHTNALIQWFLFRAIASLKKKNYCDNNKDTTSHSTPTIWSRWEVFMLRFTLSSIPISLIFFFSIIVFFKLPITVCQRLINAALYLRAFFTIPACRLH